MRWVLTALGVLAITSAYIELSSAQDRGLVQPTPEDNVDAAVEFVLTGMREARNQVVSGVARISGNMRTQFRRQPQNNLDGSISGLIAFDTGRLRYDITRPGWVTDQASIQPSDPNNPRSGHVTAKSKIGILSKKFVDDGKRITIWDSDQPLISIAQKQDLPNARVAEIADIRCPTLFDVHSLNQAWTLDKVFDNLKDSSSRCDVSVQGRSSSIWVLAWTFTGESEVTRWTLKVDISKGFTPLEFRCETALRGTQRDKSWVKEWENKTHWKQISGVWVPVDHEMRTYFNPASNVDELLKFDVKWESINQPIDDELFSYTSFDVSENVGVQDTSGGGEGVWIRPLPEPPDSLREIALAPSRYKLVLIILNVSVILFILVLLMWSRRNQRA